MFLLTLNFLFNINFLTQPLYCGIILERSNYKKQTLRTSVYHTPGQNMPISAPQYGPMITSFKPILKGSLTIFNQELFLIDTYCFK